MTDNTETNSSTKAAAKKRKRLENLAIGIGVLVLVVWLANGPSSEDSSSSSAPPATTAAPSTTEAPAPSTTAAPSTTEAPAPSTTAEATREELNQLVALGMMWGNSEEEVCGILAEGISLGVYKDEEDAALFWTASWSVDLQENQGIKPFDRTLVNLYELILEDCFGL
jgi:hypothetical protein